MLVFSLKWSISVNCDLLFRRVFDNVINLSHFLHSVIYMVKISLLWSLPSTVGWLSILFLFFLGVRSTYWQKNPKLITIFYHDHASNIKLQISDIQPSLPSNMYQVSSPTWCEYVSSQSLHTVRTLYIKQQACAFQFYLLGYFICQNVHKNW